MFILAELDQVCSMWLIRHQDFVRLFHFHPPPLLESPRKDVTLSHEVVSKARQGDVRRHRVVHSGNKAALLDQRDEILQVLIKSAGTFRQFPLIHGSLLTSLSTMTYRVP
jgi:hypothetical protein